MTIEAIDALLDQERQREARQAIEHALREVEDPAIEWRLALRAVRLDVGDRKVPIDHAILRVETLLADPSAASAELVRAHAQRIEAYARKRCQELAEAASAEAREAMGDRAQVDRAEADLTELALAELDLAEGDLALTFDDRPRARDLYARALERSPSAAAPRLAMANLCYLLGDFDGCHRTLSKLEATGADAAAALRLRAAAHAARDDHEAEADDWRRVLAAVPESDRGASDRIGLGLALASAGRRDHALEELRAVWRTEPRSSAGRYARARIEHLERAPDAAKKRLAAFPTVAQRWNYCGPAVIELCFRYLGLDMRQEEIADAVKREGGTPMFEIAAFLRRHGLVARRIAATPERLRAAIDLGVPVIVQEEYSTTSHVAVITGYDAGLGVFFSADPATHRPILKPFEWTERAGDLFGNGGLLVLGREGPETAALVELADAAGLVEEEHLSLLDRCSELRPSMGGGGTLEEAAAEEVIRLCDLALERDGAFKLAWHRRTWARLQLHRQHRTPGLRERFLRDLYIVRTSFSGDEWPHQLHGQWLLDEGRHHEAFVAYHEAWRRDPDDADDLELMGEARWLAGDLGAAETHLLEALAAEPHHERAAENLACVYVRELQRRDEEADEGATELWGPRPALPPASLSGGIERDEDDLLRRARHFSRVALSTGPDNPFNQEVAGFLRAREGDLEGAASAFASACEVAPDRPWPVFGRARCLGALGRHEETRGLLEAAVERFSGMPRAWLELARTLAEEEAWELSADVLERAMSTLQDGRSMLVAPLFHVRSRAASGEAAAARLRELAEAHVDDGELLREVAHLLDRNHQRGHAIALLRHVIEVAPGDVSSLYRLGQLLAEDLLTRDEGRAMLEQVMERVPDSPLPRVQLAWHLVDEDPEAGLALVEPVRDQEQPTVYDVESALLEAVGRTKDAERALERALAAYGSPVHGLVSLCWRHIDGNRYDRAADLATRLVGEGIPADLRDNADMVWLTAHRLAGRVRHILPRVNELCADGVPAHLSWEVYWATRASDHALAAKAALVQVEREEDPDERLEWRIRAAEELAETGDMAMLEEVAREMGDQASAWANLCWAYVAVERFEDADRAAARAVEVDPKNRDALTAMLELHLRRGARDEAIGCAHRLLELYPYEHQGAERLGIILGKSLDMEPALAYSHRSVDAAPFCHVSQRSRAIALFAAGDLDGAARHATRAAALEEPDPDDPEDEVAILHALQGDTEALERCLALQARHGFPDLFPVWRERLREVAKARGGTGATGVAARPPQPRR